MSTQSPGAGQVVVEQADVDDPPYPADVDLGQVGLAREEFHHLTGYAQAHVTIPSHRVPPRPGDRRSLYTMVHHHPGRLVHRPGDRLAESHPLVHAGLLAADHQHPARLRAEHPEHPEHHVGLHAVRSNSTPAWARPAARAAVRLDE